MLARFVAEAGHDVVVAAPAADASGSGAALGVFHADSHIDVKRVELPGCDAPAWAVAGPPGSARSRRGSARSVLRRKWSCPASTPDSTRGERSCTRARSAPASHRENFGAKGLAVSVAAAEPWRWDTAATIALEVLDLLIEAPPRSVLNLNVPALARADVRGSAGRGWPRSARCARRSARSSPTARCRSSSAPPTTSSHPIPTRRCARPATRRSRRSSASPSPGRPSSRTRRHAASVPGAPLEALHAIPDSTDSRTLRSRERARRRPAGYAARTIAMGTAQGRADRATRAIDPN